jgi:hypothetical protein
VRAAGYWNALFRPHFQVLLPTQGMLRPRPALGEGVLKRIVLYGLAVAGIVVLALGVWWLLSGTVDGVIEPSFVISAGIFLLVFAAISLRWMHETAAALLGAVAVWLVNYVGGTPLFASLALKSRWVS